MRVELSERAKDRIEAARLVIKSVEFLEAQSAPLMSKINNLRAKFEASTDYAERESLIDQLELLDPQLLVLIRRCEIEHKNLQKMIQSPIQ